MSYALSATRRSMAKRAGNHSRLYDSQKHAQYGTPTPADPDELAFVRSIHGQFDGYGDIEHCALICSSIDPVGKVTYSLSAVATNNSYFACDTSGLNCGAGATAVSDIHNHPAAGAYAATQSDLALTPGLVLGDQYKVNPMGFSRGDMGGNVSFGLNGWVVPAGTNKLLYFDSKMQYPLHVEY
jgi:hypothetical protein